MTADYTTYLNLEMPAGSDAVDISVLNSNFVKIDDGYNDLNERINFAVRNHMNQDTATSVPDKTYVSLNANNAMVLEPGNWIIVFGAEFSKNDKNDRAIFIYTSPNTQANANWERGDMVQVGAAQTSRTFIRGADIYHIESQRTIYLTVWQNSGETLACKGYLSAIKL